MPEIVKEVEFGEDEHQMSIEKCGGNCDGEIFTLVKLLMDDGKHDFLYKSNHRSGYFKHVFVPHEWTHPKIVD